MCDPKIEALNQAPLCDGVIAAVLCIILQLVHPTLIQTLISDSLAGEDLHILPIQIMWISPLYLFCI